MELKIKIDIPNQFIQKVFCALDFISQTAKIPIEINNNDYNVIYALNKDDTNNSFFKFNPKYYDGDIQFKVIDNKWVPNSANNIEDFDYIGSIYRLIRMIDEPKNLKSNNENYFSSFTTNELSSERQSFIDYPMADFLVVEGNPVEDMECLRRVKAVVLGGRLVGPQQA